MCFLVKITALNTTAQVVKVLRQGGVVCMKTDTLYALSCDALNQQAVQKVFSLKKRDFKKPVSLLVSGVEGARAYVSYFPYCAKVLCSMFWPGALTVILSQVYHATNLASALINTTIGMRAPNSKSLMRIIRELGRPILGTSANITNFPDAKSLTMVQDQLSLFHNKSESLYGWDPVNEYMSGLPSTVVLIKPKELYQYTYADTQESKFYNIILLREGQIPTAQLTAVIKKLGFNIQSNSRHI